MFSVYIREFNGDWKRYSRNVDRVLAETLRQEFEDDGIMCKIIPSGKRNRYYEYTSEVPETDALAHSVPLEEVQSSLYSEAIA